MLTYDGVIKILRNQKRKKGLSNAKIAHECGLAESTISRYLNGQREIPLTVFIKLCEVLEIDIFEILEGK